MKHKQFFAVIKHQMSKGGFLLNAGDKYPIEFIDTSKNLVQIGVLTSYYYEVIDVRPEMIELVTVEMESKYQIGDTIAVIKHKERPDHYIPFKISSVIPMRGSFWYQSEWGDQNKMWSGQMEERVYRLTDEA